jgi:hypothetical protein
LLLAAAVQEVLYTITMAEAVNEGHGPNQLLRYRLQQKIVSQKHHYDKKHTGSDLSFTPQESELSYFDKLATHPIPTDEAFEATARLSGKIKDPRDIALSRQREPAGADLATQLVATQVDLLAKEIAGNKRYRPSRYLSMDVDDPRSIALSSLANTPQTTQAMDIFSHSIASLFDPNLHVIGNLFDQLDVPDESLAVITCFDSWPFHFQFDGRDNERSDFKELALSVLVEFYRKLAPGGKIIIFPWSISSENRAEEEFNTKILEEVVIELARLVGHAVTTDTVHRETLNSWMSEADKNIAEQHSQVFKSTNQAFKALIINKPKWSSIKGRLPSLGKSALTAIQTQG